MHDENLHQELSYADLIGTSIRKTLPNCPQTLSPRLASPTHDQAPSVGRGWTETDSDSLPAFIKPVSKVLDPDNLGFLRKKGALQIPARELRDEIINCYLQYVHPQLPVLDESTLRDIARDPSSMKTAPMSILLFQAAMFSAVHFIAVDSIRKAGFDRALDIRRAFYAKARVSASPPFESICSSSLRVQLLYDFDVESDRLAIVQSLILMAYMSETPGDAKGGWHWIGAAHGLAMTLGLHRKVDYATLDPRESRLRRRIWWSCYIRDRTLALAMNRPWRIRDEDFDTPMLTLADFDLDVDQGQYQSPPDADRQDATSLAQVTVSLAQLCTQISDLLDIHFSTLPEEGSSPPSHPPDGTGLTTTLYFAKSQIKQIDGVVACDRKLQSWFINRPLACIYSPNGSRSLVLNRAFVNLVYFSLVSALHRPLLRANFLGDFVEYQMLSERRVRDAALETCRMSAHLHELGLGQYCPGAAALLQVPAIIYFLRELRSPNARPGGEIFSSIQACIDIVEDVKERHIGAQIGLIIALGLLRRSNVAVQTDTRTGRVVKLAHLNGVAASVQSLNGLESDQPQAASEPGNLRKSQTDIGRVTRASMDNSASAEVSAASFWGTVQETGVDFDLETQFFADQGFSESLVSNLFPFASLDDGGFQGFTDNLYPQVPYPGVHKTHED